MKIANFVYFCITHGKLIPTSRKRYQFSVRNTKVYKIRKLCRGIYIFLILLHFATKLCNFTNFRTLFNAVVMNFPTSTFFKILSIMQSVLPYEISKYSCMLTPKVHKKFMSVNFKIGTHRNLSEIVRKCRNLSTRPKILHRLCLNAK